ncbi:MAG: hypothetical protein ACYC1K_03450 [Minisyncoccota bacterium]
MNLNETLDSFLLLPKGWDSYNSCRFNEELIVKAKEVAKWLPGDGWQVVPGAGGTVQFEKHADGFDIEVYVAAFDGVVKS